MTQAPVAERPKIASGPENPNFEDQVTESSDLEDEELAALEGEARRIVEGDPLDKVASPDAPPKWVEIPSGLKFPPAGCEIAFLRVPAKWCRDPSLGDRQCILWMLDERDEQDARKRGRGDAFRSTDELSKACVRAIDGQLVDWSGGLGKGNVSGFWRDIGPKGRLMIRNYYVRTHSLDAEESVDFFSNHFAVVTVQKA